MGYNIAYTGPFWLQGHRTTQTAHCAMAVFDSIFCNKTSNLFQHNCCLSECVLLLYCLKEKFNFRSPFLDRLISGGLSSPISLPATATCLTTDWLLQSICSFKVSIKASTLRNRLSRFFLYINIQIHLFIFFAKHNSMQLRRWWYITNWYPMCLVILDLEIHFPVQMTLAMIRNLS